MLKSLFIKNFILIKEAKVDFTRGFNVLCGETGAGKSVIIKALDIALGAKASRDLALDKTLPILIEAEFDDNTISRVISSSSKYRLNGLLSSLEEIRELRPSLVDIHSQHDTYLYMAQKQHINLLDSYIIKEASEFEELLKAYQETYFEFLEVEKKLNSLKENLSDNEKEIDFLTFQLKELDEAAVFENEEEELKKELNILSNAQELKEGSYASYWALYGDNQSIVEALGKIKYTISSLADLDKSLKEIEEPLFDAYENLKALASSLQDYSSSLDINPNRLDEVNERISLIQKLKRKYGPELDIERDKIASRLEELTGSENNIEEVEKNFNSLQSALDLVKNQLNEYRTRYALELSKLIEEKLKTLELKEAKFKIDISKVSMNSLGSDRVEFLISTNKNREVEPLNKVASGGEISRVMLALKTIFANSDNTPTVVFDEIDTGISGVASSAVCASLCELAKSAQIISITHQPIIAAKADNFLWLKKTHGAETDISIEALNSSNRLEALAQLAGGEVNEKSLEFAKTLVK